MKKENTAPARAFAGDGVSRTGWSLATLCLVLCTCGSAVASDGDRTHYGADAASTKFADISQIDSTNFDSLRIIWRRPSADARLADSLGIESDRLRSTPIVVDGGLYTISPLNLVSALDAATGEELWTFDAEAWKVEGFFAGYARGVSYWTDGEVARVLFGTSSSSISHRKYLIAGMPAAPAARTILQTSSTSCSPLVKSPSM